jgi:exodeoxyribonuclease III
MLRLLSWNVNGIRAGLKKGFWEKLTELKPDILGIQETKAGPDIMQSGILDNDIYSINFHSSTMKAGYSGVAIFSANKPFNSDLKLEVVESKSGLGIEEFDVEGRIVLTKYKSSSEKLPTFVIINGYYPQGGRGPHRIEYKIEFYKKVKQLADKLRKEGEKVMLCGDFNTTVGDIDLARPKENKNTTGCLPEEREALDWFLKDGFVDTFRHFYPELKDKYSYWDQITRARERNVGWRIDYWLADKTLLPLIKDAYILDQVMGSDHCPVGIDLDI